ncbi:hypothetical protein AKO1_007008 [Acrasis kona]|uniref:GST N-terminal domain-containing protein n=1 Tax=Acrasis kona TaxID=1008807 RepID=A0AAW2YUR5_9EUKA
MNTKPILFYDIASGPPKRTFAPNPWKTRYALNVKSAEYETRWVELPEVESTRRALGVAPVRKLPNGEDFYTLPVIHDTSNGIFVGDTFDIALYLDEKYPNATELIPKSSVGLMSVFNAKVDAIFTPSAAIFAHGMPLNPETAEQTKTKFVARAKQFGSQATTWEEMRPKGEFRKSLFDNLKIGLSDLAKSYRFRDKGPFLEGDKLTYADLIVGGWLACLSIALEEWDEVASYDDGLWGKLHEALQKYAEIK